MKVAVNYQGLDYKFQLVSTGGITPPTQTTGIASIFNSRLTVALHGEIPDMLTFYPLLVSLTRNAWEGLIAYSPELNTRPPELTTYEIRASKKTDGEQGDYIVTIGYKINMPTNQINYSVKGNQL